MSTRSHKRSRGLSHATRVVACGVMRAEIEHAAEGLDVELVFLEQGLHMTPDRMAPAIQERVDESGSAPVLLGYGLCSGGVAGVRAGPGGLVIPRCHDCIDLFLGSVRTRMEMQERNPGVYYLIPSLLAAGKDPIGIVEREYEPRYGAKTAWWAMEEQLKHYTHLVFINNGLGDISALRARALENCRGLGKEYLEMEADLAYFRGLLAGPHDEERFIRLPPGERLHRSMWRGCGDAAAEALPRI